MSRHPRHSSKLFRRKLISLAVASCFASGLVQANPTNPVVVSGTAVMQQSGNLLSITNSPNAIINWGSFSIGANEITRFIQQSQASAVLNRVVGQDPSAILGALQSNGRVFLINPNGIVFGAGSQIDVAGLVASTLNLSDADFLAGRLRFSETLNAGSVVNQGSITTGAGGSVYLVAPDITNSGIITSPKGEVILAAGRSVELVDPGTPNLRVEISAPDTQARNLGQIVADAGRVGIYAGLINHAGTIQANSAVVGERGEIVLKATQNATLEAGSLTTANGAQGGSITIQSGDTTLVSGTVEARGTQGQGGAVQILGNLVGLTGSASIDASGETGGGTVLVGGDYQGKNPDIQNAYRTYFGPDASIKADAITSGDGGRVIVWADDATRAYGSISARGGSESGNGGFVEVSGKGWLEFAANVDTRAPSGVTGTLLLDPSDVTISNDADALAGGAFSGGIFSGATSSTTKISWATIDSQLASSSVVITTTGSGGSGDITVTEGHTYNTANSFSLLANNNITSNGAIINTGSGSIAMYAGWDGVSTSAPAVSSGDINITRSIQTGGNITLVAGSDITIQPPNNIPLSIVAGGTFTANAVAGNFLLQGGPANVSTSATENSSAAISANAVTITAGSGITVAGGDGIVADAGGSIGGITAVANSKATITATTSISLSGNSVTIRGGDNAVAVADATAGVNSATVDTDAQVSAGTTLTINATNLTIRGGFSASASAEDDVTNTATTRAGALVSAGGALALNAGSVTLHGGDNAFLEVSGGGTNTAAIHVDAQVSAGSSLTLNAGSMTVRGGDNFSASFSGSGISALGVHSGTANASALVSAGTTLSLSASSLTVRGGNNAELQQYYDGVIDGVANLNARLQAGDINLTVSGPLTVQGGSNALASAFGISGGQLEATVNAKATVQASNSLSVTVSGGTLTVAGGTFGLFDGANAKGSGDAMRASINANAELTTGGNASITVTGGNVVVRAGSGAEASASAISTGGIASAQISTLGRISAGGSLGISASGLMNVLGGGDAKAETSGLLGTAAATVTATAVVQSGGSMTLGLPGGLSVEGGGQDSSEGAFTSDSINNIATTDISARISAGGSLVYAGGSVTLQGGSDAIAGASAGGGAATSRSDAEILIAVDKTMDITGDLNILGGSISASGANSLAYANALLDPGTANITTTGDVFITGGFLTTSGGGGGTANASLTTSGPLNLTIGGATGLTMTGDPAGYLTSTFFPVNVVFTGGGTTIINTIPGRGGATTQGFGNAPESQLLVSNECDVTNPYSVCSFQITTTTAGTTEQESGSLPICR